MILLFLAACIETGLNRDKPGPAVSDTGTPDTAPPDTDIADDTSDTEVVETGDPGVDTGDTGVDTGELPDTGDVDTAIDTDTGEPVDTGEAPGPVTVSGVCTSGYPWTGWTDAAATEPELHVVGVYESQLGTGGAVDVAVARTTTMVLALTSYSAVDWRVDLPAGTGVAEIVVSSYDPAGVTFVGAGTAPVTYVGWIGSCAYEIPDMDPYSGCETPDLRVDVEAYTGLPMASFQGCYAGGTFSVDP